MGRLTKLSLLTLVAVVAFEMLVRAVSPLLPEPLEWYSGFAQRKHELIEAADFHPEAIFLGDSTTMSGLDPHRFDSDLTCVDGAFNAAIPAATPSMMADWYQRGVAKAWSPELLLIGLTGRTLIIDPVDEYFQSIAVREDWGAVVTRAAAEVSYSIRYRSVLRDSERIVTSLRSEPAWEGLDTRGWDGTRDGEYLSETGPQSIDWLGLRVWRYTTGELNAPEMEALESFISARSEEGIQTVIVWMPTTQDWVDFIGGEKTVSGHRVEVEALAKRSSASVIDLSQIDSRELFVDPLHLNSNGAEQALELLLTRLDSEICERAGTEQASS